MSSKKGWVQSESTIKGKKKDIINECLEPQLYWDEWSNWRDGMRNKYGDRSRLKKPELIRVENTYAQERANVLAKDRKKLLRHEKIRKAKKFLLNTKNLYM